MSDGDALLRAILLNPADDVARLVYADWLQENGDEPRANFIRASVEIDKLPGCGHPSPLGHSECRWCQLFVTEQNYLGSKDAIPKRALRYGQAPRGAFRRGFIFTAAPTLEQFMDNARFLFRAHPIENVSLRDSPLTRQNVWPHGLLPGYSETSLPGVLFDCLVRHPHCFAFPGPPGAVFVAFRDTSDALLTMSDACVAYGRAIVGLPALLPVPPSPAM